MSVLGATGKTYDVAQYTTSTGSKVTTVTAPNQSSAIALAKQGQQAQLLTGGTTLGSALNQAGGTVTSSTVGGSVSGQFPNTTVPQTIAPTNLNLADTIEEGLVEYWWVVVALVAGVIIILVLVG
jgi:hypothetical protein